MPRPQKAPTRKKVSATAKTGKKSAAKPRQEKAAKAAELAPRVARRERRRDRSREEIIDAAGRVLLRDGLKATTLEAVAKEVGLTKAALYYYYPSKEALLFELMYSATERHARALHDAVEAAQDGRDALRAIIRETIQLYAPRLDDFRLTFLHAQVAGPNVVKIPAEQLERIRPLNDLAYSGATKRLAEEWQAARGRADVEPRLMVFLANMAAIGVLTMKGLVENADDPLRYSDEQLIDALGRIFAAAAAP